MEIVTFDTEFDNETFANLRIHTSPLELEDFSSYIREIKRGKQSPEDPTLSVVIAAYREQQEFLDLLESLIAQQSGNDELIIVDNGLATHITKNIAYDNIIYIKTTKNVGACAGKNIGAAAAGGSNIAFLDADGCVDNSLLQRFKEAMTPGIAAVRGKVLPKTNSCNEIPPHYDLGNRVQPAITSTEGISVWDGRLFKKAGGFESNLYGHDGLVLNYRLYELFDISPEQFIYDPSLLLYHDYHDDDEHFIRKINARKSADKSINYYYPLLKYFRDYYQKFNYTEADTEKSRLFQKKAKRLQKEHRKKAPKTKAKPHRKQLDDIAFSVVIPCFNLGELLPNAIDSIKNQTLQPLEIIVVDDASTDPQTQNLLRNLGPNINVIRQESNQGVAAARNRGIEIARGEFILCLDADDTISPEYLEKAYNVFQLHPMIGLVGCWVDIFGHREGAWRPKNDVTIKDSLLTSPLPTATCFRKKAWESTPHGYNASLRGYEDWDFWISVLEAGFKAKVIPEFLFHYYTRPNSKVKTSNKNAYNLVSKIVEAHKNSYYENIAHVIALQREKLNDYSLKADKYKAKLEKRQERRISRRVKRALKTAKSLNPLNKRSST